MANADNIVRIESVRVESEQARAERYKAEMNEALLPVLALMAEAKSHGLLIEFHLGCGACGHPSIDSVEVLKRY